MQRPTLKPTINQTFVIVANPLDKSGDYDFAAILKESRRLESAGKVQQACEVRFQAFQRLVELLPDDDSTIELDWEDNTTRSALTLINLSSIDHFLVGDFELCAAMLELLLELDSEDHLGAISRLAYAYIALEEYELYDEIQCDINERSADGALLALWSDFRRRGTLNEASVRGLKTRFAHIYDEFVADQHPVDESFLAEMDKEKPSRSALARELWLQTEHLWNIFPEFIEALRQTRK